MIDEITQAFERFSAWNIACIFVFLMILMFGGIEPPLSGFRMGILIIITMIYLGILCSMIVWIQRDRKIRQSQKKDYLSAEELGSYIRMTGFLSQDESQKYYLNTVQGQKILLNLWPDDIWYIAGQDQHESELIRDQTIFTLVGKVKKNKDQLTLKIFTYNFSDQEKKQNRAGGRFTLLLLLLGITSMLIGLNVDQQTLTVEPLYLWHINIDISGLSSKDLMVMQSEPVMLISLMLILLVILLILAIVLTALHLFTVLSIVDAIFTWMIRANLATCIFGSIMLWLQMNMLQIWLLYSLMLALTFVSSVGIIIREKGLYTSFDRGLW